MAQRENGTHQLLVEGPNDLHSLIGLVKRHRIDWDHDARIPHVHATGGVDRLLETAPVAARSKQRLGIVMDADLNPAHRWAQISTRLQGIGLTLPVEAPGDGLVIPGLFPESRVGIWLMPDNASPGILEDFLSRLVDAANPVWLHARQATMAARALGAPVESATKGSVHSFLAWQEPPGQPFGVALTTRILAHDSPEANAFVHWFNRLFLD